MTESANCDYSISGADIPKESSCTSVHILLGFRCMMQRLCGLACFLAFELILFIAVGKMASEFWMAVIATVLLSILLIILFLFANDTASSIVKDLANRRSVWLIVQILSLAVLLYVAFSVRVELSWDWGQLIQSAVEYVTKGTISNRAYYARYPNNKLWLSLLIGFFQLIKMTFSNATQDTYVCASIALNCIFLLLSMNNIKRIATLLWGNGWGLIVGLLASCYIPFYLYSSFAYSDTPGILISSYAVLVYVRLMKEQQRSSRFFLASALLGLLLGFLWRIKIMLLIIGVAMIIDAVIFNRPEGISILSLVIAIIVFFLSGAILSAYSNRYLHITPEESDLYEYPMIHWIMMSANPDESGGYNTADDLFTRGFGTYQQRKDAASEEFIKRFNALGPLGWTEHILFVKPSRMWADSTMYGSNYLSRNPIHPHSLLSSLFAYRGALNKWLLIISWPLHILLLSGMLSSAFQMMTYRDSDVSRVATISLFGVFVFFLFWECNARYLYVFSPMFILSGVGGVRAIWQALVKSS